MNMPNGFSIVLAFLYGTAIGSFLNVLIWRMPREESIVAPPSHCPCCNARLRAPDLVPLFSFLLRGRRCAYCRAPISWRYFWVELLTGSYFALLVALQGLSVDTALACVFAAVLVAVFFIDLEHFIIPDELNLAGVLVGVARDGWKLWTHAPGWALARIPLGNGQALHVPRSLATGLACAGLMWAVAAGGTLLFRRDAMGLGDVKLAAAIGANLTAGAALIAIFLGVVAGAVIGVALILGRRAGWHAEIPFGPFLVFGVMIALLWGPQLFNGYVHVAFPPQ